MPAPRGSAANVMVADRGFVDPVFVGMSGINVAWQVSGSGSFGGTLNAGEYYRLGGPAVLNKWLLYEHPVCGVWGGIVTDYLSNGDQTVEITATTFDWLLLHRRATARVYKQQHGAAGALALKAIRDSQSDNAIRFTSIEADEQGEFVAITFTGETVADALATLVSDSGQEWCITVDSSGNMEFEWRVLCGADKSGSILLRDGIEIVGHSISNSIFDLANDLVAVAGDRDWEESNSVHHFDYSSVATYGRMQGAAVSFPRHVEPAAIRTALFKHLNRVSEPVKAGTLTLSDKAQALADIRDGDSVLVSLWSQIAPFTFRVVARSADVDGGTVDLAGYVP